MFKVNNINTKAPLMSFAVIVNFEYISNPFFCVSIVDFE